MIRNLGHWSFVIALGLTPSHGASPNTRAVGMAPALAAVAAVDSLLRGGHYDAAEAMARHFLADCERGSSCDSVTVLRGLSLVVEARLRAGDLGSETLQLATHELALSDSMKMSPDQATALEHVAEIEHERGDSLRVRALLLRANHLRKAASTDLTGKARTLRLQAALDFSQGNLDAALRSLARASTLLEISTRPDPFEHLAVLALSSHIHIEMGSPTRAREYAEQALIRTDANLGRSHPAYAWALCCLARSLHANGAVDSSRSLYEEAFALLAANQGPVNARAGALHRDFGKLLLDMGEYADAREALEVALSTAQRQVGSHGLTTILASGDLGYLHWVLGNAVEAAPLLQKYYVLAPLVRGYRRDHMRFTSALAAVNMQTGARKVAQHLYQQIVVSAETLTTLPPETKASVFTEYATRYLAETGEIERTVHYLELALSITKSSSRTLDTASAMARLAEALYRSGDLDRALELGEKSLVMRRAALGVEHPSTASSLDLLARVQLLRGKTAEALEYALQAEASARVHFQTVARKLSEREALRYEMLRSSSTDVALSSLGTPGDTSTSILSGDHAAGAVRQVWDQIVRSRHLVLDEMAQRVSPRFEQDVELDSLQSTLLAAKQRLATNIVKGVDGSTSVETIRRARDFAEEAERRYAIRAATHRRLETSYGLADVDHALPKGSALVAFVRFNRIEAGSAGNGRRSVLESPRYGALILEAGNQEPGWIDLAPANVVDSALAAWHRAVARAPHGSRRSRTKQEVAYRDTAERLAALVWVPLAHRLARAQLVFIVPDVSLHILSFSTLPVGRERYLVETGPVLHVLTAEKDLLPFTSPLPVGQGLLVLGGADFDKPTEPHVQLADAVIPSTRFRARSITCEDFAASIFSPLPGTTTEAEEIVRLWNDRPRHERQDGEVLQLIGPLASETAVKYLSGTRRIVHLATHGFSLDDCAVDLDATRQAVRLQQDLHSVSAESPLLLSGLALTGANLRARAADSLGASDDGILTAEEVAALDLSRVQWVVLSACESGLGSLHSGEGVLGLRRAFRIAGARTLVLSLWSVEDQATLEWMRHLYATRFAGASSAASVHAASLQSLVGRRSSGLSTHPFYWGGFIATGDWR